MVVPVYNSADLLPELVARLESVLHASAGEFWDGIRLGKTARGKWAAGLGVLFTGGRNCDA